jgi:predicted RNase H-like HicB family nuclease
MHLATQLMPSISLRTVLNPEDSGGYVALCPELDIASQGESIDDAVQNLKEAVEGFFEIASREEIESRLDARPFRDSSEARTCSRFTLGKPSRKSALESPASRRSNRLSIGTRVPGKTGSRLPEFPGPA